jgi:predicted nucleic acid-binding protein
MKYDNYFIDTNVLIYYTFPELGFYKASKKIINDLIENNITGFISKQILNEYFSITTNPRIISIPLTRKKSIDNIENFLKILKVLSEESEYNNILELLKEYNITGKKIFDLNIYNTMLFNKLVNLITANEKDFKSFKNIQIHNPFKIFENL